MDRELTPLGRMLEGARERLGISGREAARRANITEARWRQVVTGVQTRGGERIAVRPRALTVVAMATAVGVEPTEALAAAGHDARPERVAALVGEIQRVPASDEQQVAAEVERIMALNMSLDARLRMVRALREAWEHRGQDVQTLKDVG